MSVARVRVEPHTRCDQLDLPWVSVKTFEEKVARAKAAEVCPEKKEWLALPSSEAPMPILCSRLRSVLNM